jgi:uncharacterized protein (TIGR02266 family)
MYIQYGIGRPKEEAETEDLSEGGLFIKTDSPMPIGTDVAMRLELEGFSLPLAGIVCWVKERDEDGKPAGMGVKLDNPHPRYVHYVRQQRKTSEVTEHALEELKKDAAGG